jgi:hypothetical protein
MSDHPHRVLHMGERGDDVRAFQKAISKRLKARKLDSHAPDADGDFGPRTADAAARALWELGAEMATVRDADVGKVTIGAQRLVIFPKHRVAEQLKRAHDRNGHSYPLDDVSKPPYITSAELGLTFQWVFGGKGKIYRGAGHYTAGHRVPDRRALAAEMRMDHSFHRGKGWGGLSYEVMIADDGTVGFGNPPGRKSAAVALNNTGLVNICCPGTTGDNMTARQKDSVVWMLRNWHTSKVPAAYRLDTDARFLLWKPHLRWPSQSTACPGNMEADYYSAWTKARYS